MDSGTDVNFGALTRMLFEHLKEENVEINYKHYVKDIKRTSEGLWEVKVHDIDAGQNKSYIAKFIFIGAGGGSLPLLQKREFLNQNILAVSRLADYLWFVK